MNRAVGSGHGVSREKSRFQMYPDQVCYVPELSDAAYTRQDFQDMCNGQAEFAAECLNAAAYNPCRDLQPGDKDYEKLKCSIEEFEFVEPVVWNRRTGFAVGEHRRLKGLNLVLNRKSVRKPYVQR